MTRLAGLESVWPDKKKHASPCVKERSRGKQILYLNQSLFALTRSCSEYETTAKILKVKIKVLAAE